MIDDSPALKLQRLGLIMQNYVIPMMPEIQRQGGHVDVQAILDLVAKYADFKELRDIVFFMEPGAMGEQQVRQQYTPKPTDSVAAVSGAPTGRDNGAKIIQQLLSASGSEASE